MRILVLGAGVIGNVYAGRLLKAGHEVVLLARGERLVDLHALGLILQDAESRDRTTPPIAAVSEPGPDDRYDLVVVPVRAEQLESTLPVLTTMTDGSDVLFFGNTAKRQAELADALGQRALFGFPAAGGVRDGSVIRYVLITQQKTMLGEPDGTTTARVRELQGVLTGAGLPTVISANIAGWLQRHAAFVVPTAFALYRVDVDASRLAADPATGLGARHPPGVQRLALRRERRDPHEPAHPLRLPTVFVMAYWRRVFASPRGELCSAPTAEPPLRRCARSRTNCEKPCAVPVGPLPTSTVCWPPQPEPGELVCGRVQWP